MKLRLELQRSINNYSFVYCIITVCFTSILGYVLLIGVDKNTSLSIQQFILSNYTVLTQFGRMLFPVIIAYSISTDYKEKNVIFYKKLGYNSVKYFLTKIIVNIIWLSLGVFIIVTVTSLLFDDYSYFLVCLLYYENIIVFIVLISSVCAFVFNNLIVAFGANLILWIGSIFAFSIGNNIRFLAFYDSTNILYSDFSVYLYGLDKSYLHIGTSILFNATTFCVSLIIIQLLSKRWIKNGC